MALGRDRRALAMPDSVNHSLADREQRQNLFGPQAIAMTWQRGTVAWLRAGS